MKHLILLICALLLFACSNDKKVYLCGDHACINKKEKEAYFKKTMIIEIREINKKNKKSKSDLEIIKEQVLLKQKKEIKGKKELAKQARLEEKRRIKEGKELSKRARIEEKRRIKEENKLTKQARLEEKKIIKRDKKKLSKKQMSKAKNFSLKNKNEVNTYIENIDVSSAAFEDQVKKITKKNEFRSYPNINDIPN